MKIFQKIGFFFGVSQKQDSLSDSLCMRLILRREILEKPLPGELSTYIKLYRSLGHQVTVEELTEEIPSEYAGVRVLRENGTQREWRAYLKLHTRPVVETILSFDSIDPLIPPLVEGDSRNTNFP